MLIAIIAFLVGFAIGVMEGLDIVRLYRPKSRAATRVNIRWGMEVPK